MKLVRISSLQQRGTVWGSRLTMLLLLITAVIVDLFFFQESPGLTDLVAVAVLSVSAMLFLVWPRLGGWAYLTADTVFVAFPDSFVGMLGYLCIAVVFSWGWHKYRVDSAIGIALLTFGFFQGAPKYPATGILTLVLLVASFTAGYVLRRYIDERDAAVSQLWEQKLQVVRETQVFRDGLSAQLHDSVAGTLSVVVSLSEVIYEDLPAGSAARSEMDLLRSETRGALSELREIIQLLDTRPSQEQAHPNLEKELKRATDVAAGAGLSLELACDPEELKGLPDSVQNLLTAVVRETLTNAIKYASPSAPVTLSITRGGNLVEFMMKNRVSETVQDAVMSSGKGLLVLRKLLEDAGGNLEVWASSGWWNLHAEVPCEEENTDV